MCTTITTRSIIYKYTAELVWCNCAPPSPHTPVRSHVHHALSHRHHNLFVSCRGEKVGIEPCKTGWSLYLTSPCLQCIENTCMSIRVFSGGVWHVCNSHPVFLSCVLLMLSLHCELGYIFVQIGQADRAGLEWAKIWSNIFQTKICLDFVVRAHPLSGCTDNTLH